MKIKTSLNIAVVIFIAGFISFAVFSTSAFARINNARLNSVYANRVVANVGNLRGLTLEYLHFPSERVIDQIYRQQRTLSDNLDLVSPSKEDALTISELKNDDAHLDYLFEQLIAASTSGNEDLENLLAGQISVISEKIVTNAVKLSNSSEENIRTTLRYAYYSIATFSIALFTLVLIFIYLFNKKVVKPLIELEKGTKAVATGNFEYKVPVKTKDEIGVLADSFNRMSIKLRELDDIKTQFLNTAAHQLRTPTSSIRWNVEELLKNRSDYAKKATDKLEQIHKSTIYMIGIVTELLNVSRLGDIKTTEAQVSIRVNKLIDDVIGGMEHEFSQKEITVKRKYENNNDIILSIDSTKLTTVVDNLISNAVNYNRRGGSIEINTKETPKWIEISVSDTGIGIPKSEYPGIFTKFYRATNAVKLKPDGSGLGLYTARSYVESWGGALSFDSIEGVGSTFRIKLPKSFKTNTDEK